MKYLLIEARVLLDEDGNFIGVFEVLQDITNHKRIEDQIKLSASVFDNTSEGIMITDSENKIISSNKAMEKLSGYKTIELLGKNPRVFASKRHSTSFFKEMWGALKKHGHWQGEFWNKDINDKEYLVRAYISKVMLDDQINHIAILTDITEKNKSIEQINFLAHHDFLTQLPNRILLEDRLAQSFNRCERSEKKCAILFMDLDKFKNVNDTFGHDGGDFLLKEVAKRIKKSVRGSDTVARQGGDEFVVLLEQIESEMDVTLIVQKIIKTIEKDIVLDGTKISISCSVGISIYPNDGKTVNAILKNADTAMYHTKYHGRKGYSFYNKNMNENALETLQIVNKLSTSLSELLVYYQPQFSVKNEELIGAEALVRWNDKDLGFVSPAKFIPIAEETGLIKDIGLFVLREACKVLKETGLKISVNVSPIQLEDDEFIKKLAAIIRGIGINPDLLTLEITESAFIKNFEEIKCKLNELKSLGIKLALDDFGTGYSSLSYLNQLPFDYLKIDRSFIQDERNTAIISAILNMTGKLNLISVAEGVEKKEQMKILKKNKCDIVQGFLYSKPLTVEDFKTLVKIKKI